LAAIFSLLFSILPSAVQGIQNFSQLRNFGHRGVSSLTPIVVIVVIVIVIVVIVVVVVVVVVNDGRPSSS
jgi:heme/copper-type cytochrome/quinol oxidase subunit 2